LIFDLETIYSLQPDAIVREFSSHAQWERFAAEAVISERKRMAAIAARAERLGVHRLSTGFIEAPRITRHPDGLHWDIVANGISPVEAPVLELLAATPFARRRQETRIYAAEALSPLAMALRATYPKFIGSQYAPDDETRERIFPVQHQDLTGLTFPSDAFDVVITIEVLEHIPDMRRALAEVARVLRPGGIMLSTFPFAWNSPTSRRKARLDGDKIIHLVDTPEFHGDPMRNQGILVFQIPGWDIVELAKDAGFANAGFVFYSSAIGGIVGWDLIGRFVFVGYK
jgi:SAM-dependent methyltransferase